MGTPEFAVPILKSIHKSKHEILAVYTQSAKKKNRGQKIITSPINQCAEKLSITNIKTPDNLNTQKEYEFIKKLNVNLVLVVAYGKIIPKNILDIPNVCFVNIHASILPKWRGAAPIQRAIMNMDKETGISIMKIEKELDSGPVMKFSKINISKDCNYESLSKRLSILAASIIVGALDTIENKKEKFVPQDHKKATYAKKIEKAEAKINWNDTAENIVAKINAFNPNPGSWFSLNGIRIKVIKAKEINQTGSPGEVIDNNFTIGCSEKSVQILELKKEGKKTMKATDFLKGNKLKIGTSLDVL